MRQQTNTIQQIIKMPGNTKTRKVFSQLKKSISLNNESLDLSKKKLKKNVVVGILSKPKHEVSIEDSSSIGRNLNQKLEVNQTSNKDDISLEDASINK